MTTDNQTVEPMETQDAPDAPETQAVSQESPPDYKAMFEEANAEREKLRNDLKAQQTSRMKQTERDAWLARIPDIVDQLTSQGRHIEALVKSRATEDDELGKEAGRIQFETSQSKAERILRERYDEAQANVAEIFIDGSGNPMLDHKSPEFAEGWARFNQGAMAGLTLEQRQAHWIAGERMLQKAARLIEKGQLKTAHQTAFDTERKLKRKAKDDSLDLDAGVGAGSGNVSSEDIDAKWLEHEIAHPDRKNPYEKQYRDILSLSR